jgi:hypothetical protein
VQVVTSKVVSFGLIGRWRSSRLVDIIS